MEENELLNISEFARRIGVSRPAISKAIKVGRLRSVTIKGKKLLSWPEQRDVYMGINNKSLNRKPAESSFDIIGNEETEERINAPIKNIHDARFQSEAYKAKKGRLEFEEMNGNLIKIKDVQSFWAELAIELRKSILAIPARIGPILAGESDTHECTQILKNELIDSLRAMVKSNLKNKEIHEEGNSILIPKGNKLK